MPAGDKFNKSGLKKSSSKNSRASKSSRPHLRQTLQPSSSQSRRPSRNVQHKKGVSVDATSGRHRVAPDVPQLNEAEKLALTQALPQSKRFTNALSKVVNSVQARKKQLNIGQHESMQTTIMAIPQGMNRPEGSEVGQSRYQLSGQPFNVFSESQNLQQISGSELGAGFISNKILQKAGQSTGGFNDNLNNQVISSQAVRTSAHIRDAAKRELDIYKSHDNAKAFTKESDSKTLVTHHGYPEVTDPPRVVD